MSNPRTFTVTLTRSAHTRRALTAVTALGLALLCASPARASSDDRNASMILFPMSVIVAGASTLTFGTVDIVYGAQGRWLPRGWAVSQMAVGGVSNAVMAGITLSIMDKSDETSAVGVAMATTGLVMSAWFITHGIVSLVKHRDPMAAEHAALCGEHALWVSAGPTRDGGGVAVVGGRF